MGDPTRPRGGEEAGTHFRRPDGPPGSWLACCAAMMLLYSAHETSGQGCVEARFYGRASASAVVQQLLLLCGSAYPLVGSNDSSLRCPLSLKGEKWPKWTNVKDVPREQLSTQKKRGSLSFDEVDLTRGIDSVQFLR